MDAATWLDKLNPQQRAAATAENDRPLLIIAGAGTGKTNTLAHRVAWLINVAKIDPGRILLLTFTRRAAAEMLRRVENISAAASKLTTRHSQLTTRLWGGTFHAIGTRLLRMYAEPLGLAESFTVLDRSDAEDVLDEVRSHLGLDKSDVRFPKKGTCMSIYSRCVNAQEPIDAVLKAHFPWCQAFPDQLKQLFAAYVGHKQQQNILDYDDLLLYWFHLMQDASLAADVRRRFDAVLVDEYQDTNALQAEILKRLCPDGRGLTVVGDDAQSIYAFRAATVHNILDFPKTFPAAQVCKLEESYRSVQPILDATNRVIALSPQRHEKVLFSTRKSRQKPRLVTLLDEEQQSDYVIGRILEHREAGIALKKQAVLFRAAHHSDALEIELGRRGIPFVKYGGLKFLEAAHVKDALAYLRLAENPRDTVSAFRVLQLIDGIGPAQARKAIEHLSANAFELKSWQTFAAPSAAAGQWPKFVSMLIKLAPNNLPLSQQVADVREFYSPILDKFYDGAEVRKRDLEQLEQIASNFANRQQFLTDLTLDPPASTQDLAGPPLMEEDYLILSTIHSAKGCEWDAVYVIHAADGNIPSDMSTGSEEEIEEERRLFYVALTRAKDFLEVCVPLKYYAKKWGTGDRHSYSQITRFLPDQVIECFERVAMQPKVEVAMKATVGAASDVKKKIAAMWA
jgi:DNA helicase II / ATP-dependent DNA helicase PcrA